MYMWDETRTVNNLKKDIKKSVSWNRDNNARKSEKYFTMKSLILAQDER